MRMQAPWSLILLAGVYGCTDEATPSGGSSTSGDESTGDPSTTLPPPGDSSGGPPATSTDDSGSDTASTGATTECGDGRVEGDEQCDDGNTENGDDCYSDCTIAYEIAWEVSLHTGNLDDIPSEAVVDRAGNIYVAGARAKMPADNELWIQQVTADGRLGWSWVYDNPLTSFDTLSAIEWLDGDLVVAGSIETAEGYDGIVLRVHPDDQSIVWEMTFDGPGVVEVDDSLDDLAVDADGSVIVSGSMGVDDEERDAWVARLDGATGALVWEAYYQGPKGFDGAHGVDIAADGTIHAAGSEETDVANQYVGFHLVLDAAGTQIGLDATSFPVLDLAIDPATGDIAAAGYGDGVGVSGCNLRRYDASFAEQWVVGASGIAADSCRGVTFGPDSETYVGGHDLVTGQQSNYVVARISPTGEVLWLDSHNNRLDLYDTSPYVVVDPTGAVIGLGLEAALGEGDNLFMRKYTQGPPPA